MRKLGVLKTFAEERNLLFREIPAQDEAVDNYIYSRDMRYRYAFARYWKSEGDIVLWVGINPATGDTEKRRRPTLDRCVRWSIEWGAAGLIYANLFAARHTDPKALHEVSDPVGPHNDAALALVSQIADHTVVAWGNSGKPEMRAMEVIQLKLLHNPSCLGVTSKGQPRHPLYVRGGTTLVSWPGGPSEHGA